MTADISKLKHIIADVDKSLAEIKQGPPIKVKFMGKDVSKVVNNFLNLIRTIKEALGGSWTADAGKKLQNQFKILKQSLNEEREVLSKNKDNKEYFKADLVMEVVIFDKTKEILAILRTLKAGMSTKERATFEDFDKNLVSLHKECDTFIKIDERVLSRMERREDKKEREALGEQYEGVSRLFHGREEELAELANLSDKLDDSKASNEEFARLWDQLADKTKEVKKGDWKTGEVKKPRAQREKDLIKKTYPGGQRIAAKKETEGMVAPKPTPLTPLQKKKSETKKEQSKEKSVEAPPSKLPKLNPEMRAAVENRYAQLTADRKKRMGQEHRHVPPMPQAKNQDANRSEKRKSSSPEKVEREKFKSSGNTNELRNRISTTIKKLANEVDLTKTLEKIDNEKANYVPVIGEIKGKIIEHFSEKGKEPPRDILNELDSIAREYI